MTLYRHLKALLFRISGGFFPFKPRSSFLQKPTIKAAASTERNMTFACSAGFEQERT